MARSGVRAVQHQACPLLSSLPSNLKTIGASVTYRGRRESLIQGRCVKDRFESGSYLALRLQSAVELALTKISTADHRPNEAILNIIREQSTRHLGLLLERRLDDSLRPVDLFRPSRQSDLPRGAHRRRRLTGSLFTFTQSIPPEVISTWVWPMLAVALVSVIWITTAL